MIEWMSILWMLGVAQVGEKDGKGIGTIESLDIFVGEINILSEHARTSTFPKR